MTLAQLASFVTVARLGSVKDAANELGVTEAAVSLAVAALRKEVGDQLYTRTGHGIALTEGGRRFVTIANEILGQAHNARSVGEAPSEQVLLRVAATSTVAEHVAGPLLAAFGSSAPDLEISLEEEPGTAFADLLEERRADIALGPKPRGVTGIETVPFLRFRLVVVAAPGHPLAGLNRIPPARLASERWLVGAGGLEASTPAKRWFDRAGIRPQDVRAFPSSAAALAAVASGEGLMLAVAHTIVDSLRRSSVVQLDVRGTPVADLWFASVLAHHRALPAARMLMRFVQTRDATRTMLDQSSGVPVGRFRPPVHVTLWSSVASELDGAGAKN
jgi:LysR family transcriptional regulator, low CO2-responsive transcriptional regulator